MSRSFSLISDYNWAGINRKITFSAYQTPEPAYNRSLITWTLTVSGSSTAYSTAASASVGDIGDLYNDFSETGFPATPGNTSGSFYVYHNNSGSRSIWISLVSLVENYTDDKDAWWYLDSIPKAAKLVWANDIYDDTTSTTIEYTNPLGNDVAALHFVIRSRDRKKDYLFRGDINKTSTSHTIDFTTAEINELIRDVYDASTGVKLVYCLETTIGSTTYESTLDRTFFVLNGQPTISPTIADFNSRTNELTGSPSKFIRYHSDLAYNINATAYKGATIKEVMAWIGTEIRNTAIGSFYGVSDELISFKATDTRNEVAADSLSLDMIPYVKPSCSQAIDIEFDGETEAIANVVISGSYFNDTFGAVDNSLKIYIRHTNNEGEMSDWVELTDGLIPVFNGNTYSLDFTVRGLLYNNTYTFQSKVVDELNEVLSVEKTVEITPIFDWSNEDFNFNVPLIIQGSPLADYVIEQGDDGSYGYRKWYSGRMEAWRSATSSVSVNATTANGSMFYADYSLGTTGKASGFHSVSSVQMTVNKNGGYGLWYPVVKSWVVENGKVTINYSLVNPTSISTTLMPCVYIIGRWKA